MIEQYCDQATGLANALRCNGFEVVNRVVLNQVLVRGRDDAETKAIQAHVHESGEIWFGTTMWEGRAAFCLSVSSWRTTNDDIAVLHLSRRRTAAE